MQSALICANLNTNPELICTIFSNPAQILINPTLIRINLAKILANSILIYINPVLICANLDHSALVCTNIFQNGCPGKCT